MGSETNNQIEFEKNICIWTSLARIVNKALSSAWIYSRADMDKYNTFSCPGPKQPLGHSWRQASQLFLGWFVAAGADHPWPSYSGICRCQLISLEISNPWSFGWQLNCLDLCKVCVRHSFGVMLGLYHLVAICTFGCFWTSVGGPLLYKDIC